MNKVIPKEFRPSKGSKNGMIDESDKANQAALEETDLRIIIKKYGIIPEKKAEPIYDISIGNKTPIAQRLKYAEGVEQYFETLPAKIRKDYKDDYRNLYIDLINKNYSRLEKGKLQKKRILTNRHMCAII